MRREGGREGGEEVLATCVGMDRERLDRSCCSLNPGLIITLYVPCSEVRNVTRIRHCSVL